MKSFRTERLGELIRREVSDLILRGLKDTRIQSGMVSVTDVEVTGDLREATIHVSIYGDSEAQTQAMEGLVSAKGFVRSELGKRIKMRHTPEVTFVQDVSLERGDRIMALLNQIKKPESESLPSE